MAIRADTVVFGAGMAGVGAALALQARGRDVALIDRRGAAGRETSYGNAGLIERASVELYTFPRDPGTILRTILGNNPAARIDWTALPQTLPWIARYFLDSAPALVSRTRWPAAALPLIEGCLDEHLKLAQAAGWRSDRSAGSRRFQGVSPKRRWPGGYAADARRIREFGLTFDALDAPALAKFEPSLNGFAGAIMLRDPAACVDPGGLVAAYAGLFARNGGRLFSGDARSLAQTQNGWSVATEAGVVEAREAVVALGPWSDDIFKPLGYVIPLGVKRGYHMHYRPAGNNVLNHPVLDVDGGYLVAPMVQGLRLATGAECRLCVDAPPFAVPARLRRSSRCAARAFAARRGGSITSPWLGRRFNLPFYSWYQRTYGGAEVLGLFWYDTRGQDPVASGLPVDAWFRGATGATNFAVQDIVTLRSRWQDPRATYLAAKAGEVGATTAHSTPARSCSTRTASAGPRSWAPTITRCPATSVNRSAGPTTGCARRGRTPS